MTYEATIKVPKSRLNIINRYLSVQPSNPSECLPEDETITETATFSNGMEMDIKCCGVQFVDETNNTAWSEAVLFHNGWEVSCSPIDCEFDGDWELEYNGDTYIAHVIQEDE